jgi:hypothetical protein
VAAANKPGAMKGSFADSLGTLLQQIGGMMSTPDADVDFLQKMQLVIVTKIKQVVNQGLPSKPAGAPGDMGSSPDMSGNPAAGGAGGPMLAGPPGPAGQGVSPLAQAPNPDELRRVLSGAGGGQ